MNLKDQLINPRAFEYFLDIYRPQAHLEPRSEARSLLHLHILSCISKGLIMHQCLILLD